MNSGVPRLTHLKKVGQYANETNTYKSILLTDIRVQRPTAQPSKVKERSCPWIVIYNLVIIYYNQVSSMPESSLSRRDHRGFNNGTCSCSHGTLKLTMATVTRPARKSILASSQDECCICNVMLGFYIGMHYQDHISLKSD